MLHVHRFGVVKDGIFQFVSTSFYCGYGTMVWSYVYSQIWFLIHCNAKGMFSWFCRSKLCPCEECKITATNISFLQTFIWKRHNTVWQILNLHSNARFNGPEFPHIKYTNQQRLWSFLIQILFPGWEYNYTQREFSAWEFSDETQTWGS